MKSILLFITKHLLSIHTGTIAIKLKSSFVLGASAAPFVYIHSLFKGMDFDIMIVISLAIGVDHLVGSIVHLWIKKDWSWKENAKGFFLKLFLCVSAFYLFEGMSVILKGADTIELYFKVTTSLIVFMYPAGSAFVNMSLLTGGKFPPTGWIDKIQSFNKNPNIKTFTNGASTDSTFPDRD